MFSCDHYSLIERVTKIILFFDLYSELKNNLVQVEKAASDFVETHEIIIKIRYPDFEQVPFNQLPAQIEKHNIQAKTIFAFYKKRMALFNLDENFIRLKMLKTYPVDPQTKETVNFEYYSGVIINIAGFPSKLLHRLHCDSSEFAKTITLVQKLLSEEDDFELASILSY